MTQEKTVELDYLGPLVKQGLLEYQVYRERVKMERRENQVLVGCPGHKDLRGTEGLLDSLGNLETKVQKDLELQDHQALLDHQEKVEYQDKEDCPVLQGHRAHQDRMVSLVLLEREDPLELRDRLRF